jgi:hypothetical protein
MARILVVEPVAQAGIDLLAAAHETDVRLNLTRSDLLGLDCAVLEENQRGDAADAELGRRLGVLVDIQFGHLDLVAVFSGNLVQDGGDHLAGAAPFGPEIQQHGLLGLQDVLGERGIRGVHDMRATHAV